MQGEIERSKKPALSRGRHWHIEEIDGERVLCILVRSGSARILDFMLAPLGSFGLSAALAFAVFNLGLPFRDYSLLTLCLSLFGLSWTHRFLNERNIAKDALWSESWVQIRSDRVERWREGRCIWYGSWTRVRLAVEDINAREFQLSQAGHENLRIEVLDSSSANLLKTAVLSFSAQGAGAVRSLSEHGPLSTVLDAEGRLYSRRVRVIRWSMAKGLSSVLLIAAVVQLYAMLTISAIALIEKSPSFIIGFAALILIGLPYLAGVALRWAARRFFPRDGRYKNYQLVLSQGEWSLHGSDEVIPLGRDMQINDSQVTFQRTDTGEKVVLFGKAWMPVQDSAE